jgi:SET domain-containing protein
MTVLTVDDRLEIRDSPVHGRGVFARQPIPAGARVLEYTGERISKAESLRRCEDGNVFVLALDDHWDIDGAVGDNPARWINHSCAPNCEAVIEDEPAPPAGPVPPDSGPILPPHGRVYIDTIRAIAAGEELAFNYGYDLEDCRDYPCRCGAPSCVGFIVAAECFPQLRRQPNLGPTRQGP